MLGVCVLSTSLHKFISIVVYVRKTIEARDNSISERDNNISDLRKETDAISDKLKVKTPIK